MHILHILRKNAERLAWVIDQDFGLVQEVSSWAKDLEAPKTIKGQKYTMLTIVYFRDELDKIDDWIDSIEDGNKVMLSLYGNTQCV